MTDTFTLTGRILDKSTAPVARARLVLSSIPTTLRDPVTNEVYAPPPRITTDDDGYLCVADAHGNPADTPPGIDLVVGVQYRLRSVNRALLDEVVFTAPDAGETLDYADIESEPVDLPPTWADEVAALRSELGAGYIVFSPTEPTSDDWLLWYVTDPDTGLIIDANERVA